MFIPKGAIYTPNIWHVNPGLEIYGENAAHFNPARHPDASKDVVPGPLDAKEEGHISYGFGRRLCVGRYVADDALFINMAILL
jgi:cytochrome P450